MSQQPAGEPLSLCQPPPLPAHPAFSLVTAIEGSWTLSFLLSWGGGKEGTGSFSLYVKRLGASTSTTLGLNSGLGIRREPPSVRHTHTQKKKPSSFCQKQWVHDTKVQAWPGRYRRGGSANPLLAGCPWEASGDSSHLPSFSRHAISWLHIYGPHMGCGGRKETKGSSAPGERVRPFASPNRPEQRLEGSRVLGEGAYVSRRHGRFSW